MPVRFRVIPGLRMIVSTASHVLTPELLVRHDRDAVAHSRYDRSFGLLFDARRVTEFRISADDLRFQAEGARRYSYVAVVAPTDLGFGLARVYQAYTPHDDEAFAVFRRGHDAWTWLRGRLAECP